ncbi:hypothetical protein ACFX11_037009 [Malus domestica]
MEASGSNGASIVTDEMALRGLLEAFGPAFSLDQIASAYCKAGKNAEDAAEALALSAPDGGETSRLPVNGIYKKPPYQANGNGNGNMNGNGNPGASKPKYRPVSAGSVSNIIGKHYVKKTSRTPANGSSEATKPLKLNSSVLPMSEIWVENDESSSSKDDRLHQDMEDFLFSMLGVGFKLERDRIRQVLDSCGYDMEKSMEKLINLPALTSEKRNELVGKSSEKSADLSLKYKVSSDRKSKNYTEGNRDRASNTNGAEVTEQQKERNDIPKDILASLFGASEGTEETPVERPRSKIKAGSRYGAYGHLVAEPPQDFTSEYKSAVVYQQHHVEDDADDEDSYQGLRKSWKEYRSTMNDYYQAAVAAFAKKDRDQAYKLLEQGRFFLEKACEVEEKSNEMILKPRNVETQGEIVLDVQECGAKEAIRLLKCQISSFSGISSIKFLKVICDTKEEDISKGSRRRSLILKLLQEESIKWTEGENAGTILIHLDSVNRRQKTPFSMGGSVKDVQSQKELDSLVHGGSPVVLHFWASWCEASKHMDEVFAHLSADFPQAHFLRVEAEEQPEISEAYSVSAVPFFAFVKDGRVADTLEGADPSGLANKVARVAGSVNPGESVAPASLGMAAGPTILETVQELARENGSSQVKVQAQNVPADALKRRLQQLIDSNPVMLFMKGSPEAPQCGFSQKVVDILKEEKVKFGSFDILSDSEVREELKKFSNWPTFPQLYCKGELLGGCDIAISMHESGELKEVFRDHGIDTTDSAGAKVTEAGSGKGGFSASTGVSETLNSRLESLINKSPVVLFMKGKPDEPKCGFSRKVVDILVQEKVDFESFDILSDDEVRQGLKVYSNWSSYPQLYIKGELIGGSDIVLEMQRSGELKKVLADKGIVPKDTLEDRLKKLITSSQVMVFIKGTPDAPRCGFSSKVVNALREEGVSFGSFDILSDEDVRQGLKVFSNWPTFPQLYYKGELIGGCDIVMELKSNGELKSTLTE